ncbi:hypothetical protein FB451DRAFT_1187719 [Mycena latifolia]|nr:hypothetical protein FB451DRAFT_1187719 [Mycena latifolia]
MPSKQAFGSVHPLIDSSNASWKVNYRLQGIRAAPEQCGHGLMWFWTSRRGKITRYGHHVVETPWIDAGVSDAQACFKPSICLNSPSLLAQPVKHTPCLAGALHPIVISRGWHLHVLVHVPAAECATWHAPTAGCIGIHNFMPFLVMGTEELAARHPVRTRRQSSAGGSSAHMAHARRVGRPVLQRVRSRSTRCMAPLWRHPCDKQQHVPHRPAAVIAPANLPKSCPGLSRMLHEEGRGAHG